MTPRDQPIQFAAHVLRRDFDVVAVEENELEGALLVAQERLPRALAVDAHGLRLQQVLDDAGVTLGKPKRGEEAERDRLAVRDALVASGRLERVRERVAEVEHLPLAVVVRVAEADGRLEGGAAPDELVVGKLPQRLAGEQAGLHDLGHPLAPLRGRQRLEQRGIDHRAHRPVERADEVLALRQVDRGLAADRRVDLGDEARRNRHPGDAAEIGRCGEAGRVGRAAAAERDDRAGAVEPQLLPEPVERGERLRLFARRQLVRLREPAAQCELRVGAVDAGDVRIGDERNRTVARDELVQTLERAALDTHACRGENDIVNVARDGIRDLPVERRTLIVEREERTALLRERTVRVLHPFPGHGGIDVDEHRHGVLTQRLAHSGLRNSTATERKDRWQIAPQRA